MSIALPNPKALLDAGTDFTNGGKKPIEGTIVALSLAAAAAAVSGAVTADKLIYTTDIARRVVGGAVGALVGGPPPPLCLQAMHTPLFHCTLQAESHKDGTHQQSGSQYQWQRSGRVR